MARASTIDIGAVWNGIFRDPSLWSKTLVGSLMVFGSSLVLPLLFTGPVLLGYLVATARNALAGDEYPMPEWQEFGELWIQGAKATVAIIVYLAPVAVLFGLLVASGIAVGALAPRGQQQAIFMIGVPLFYLGIFAGSIYALLFRFTVYPAIILRLTTEDRLIAILSPTDLFRAFAAALWGVLLASLIGYAGNFVAGIASCFCILPGFPVSFLVHVLVASLLGQAQALADDVEPIPAEP